MRSRSRLNRHKHENRGAAGAERYRDMVQRRGKSHRHENGTTIGIDSIRPEDVYITAITLQASLCAVPSISQPSLSASSVYNHHNVARL